MKPVLVSFVIPVRNGMTTLPTTLQSIASQSNQDFELIVVNNGSSDGLSDYVGTLDFVKHVTCAKVGRGAARNAGAQIAEGKYLAFVDADVVLGKHWLKNALEYMEAQRLDGLATQIVPASNDGGVVDRFRTIYGKWKSQDTFLSLHKAGGPRPVVNTAACIFTKTSFLAVGGFAENLHRNEDLDLSFRLFYLGYLLGGTTTAKARVVFSSRRNWTRSARYLLRAFESTYYSPFPPPSLLKIRLNRNLLDFICQKTNDPKLLFYASVVNGAWITGDIARRFVPTLRPLPIKKIPVLRKTVLYSFRDKTSSYVLSRDVNLLAIDQDLYLFRGMRDWRKLEPNLTSGLQQILQGRLLSSKAKKQILDLQVFEKANA
jgi:glycosyltransferase involved in cell wall biosynthesis